MAATVSARAARSSIKYLLVLDFEATCGDTVQRQEIIEFPTLIYNFHEGLWGIYKHVKGLSSEG